VTKIALPNPDRLRRLMAVRPDRLPEQRAQIMAVLAEFVTAAESI
jgi:hypothetical protein